MSRTSAFRPSPRLPAGDAGRRFPPSPRARAAVLAGVAVVALAAGLAAGARFEPPERVAAQRFADAWERGDPVAMYRLLTPEARTRAPVRSFLRAYRDARDVLTLVRVETGRAEPPRDGAVIVPVRLHTRVFGELSGRLSILVGELEDGGAGVDWSRRLLFPGLLPGERLRRETSMPPRAPLPARDAAPPPNGQ